MKLGITCFLEQITAVSERRLGLVTNHSGVDSQLQSAVDLLMATGRLRALFAPEHGVRGDRQAGEKVESYIDATTNLPVYSLYGETKKPTPEMLQDLDGLLFDIQDIGCRFYTYIGTLLYILEAAAEYALPLYVCDRPNPLGGLMVEGNIPEPTKRSFVGPPLPIRHALTMGELACYLNERLAIGADLRVVSMVGWQRSMLWEGTGLSWVPPSPNIPSLETVLVYPGTCFFEGTNMSEGRGTTLPFQVIGAPWISGEDYAARLNSLGLLGVRFRPTTFTPAFSKYQGEMCFGVQVHVLDRSAFRAVRTGLAMVATAARYKNFAFLPFFRLLAGTDQVEKVIASHYSLDAFWSDWQAQAIAFMEDARAVLLYS